MNIVPQGSPLFLRQEGCIATWAVVAWEATPAGPESGNVKLEPIVVKVHNHVCTCGHCVLLPAQYALVAADVACYLPAI